jgi:hypothetical protein
MNASQYPVILRGKIIKKNISQFIIEFMNNETLGIKKFKENCKLARASSQVWWPEPDFDSNAPIYV